MTEQQIISYLHEQSHGVIKLSYTHARAIINMIIGGGQVTTAFVQLHQICQQTKNPILIRTIATTDNQINAEIIKALETPPNKDFFFYRCFNSQQEYEGCIYSTNPNLF